MAKKTKEKKIIKPSLETIKAMDEIVLIHPEKMLENIDIPIFSDDIESKFIATESYTEKVKLHDIQLNCNIEKIVMRIPELFNTICFQVEPPMPTYVVVKDKGSSLKFTCYNYINLGKEQSMMFKKMLNVDDVDDSWIWTYETDGREILVEGIRNKNGEYYTTGLANGKIEMNYKFPSFAPVLSGLKDKRQGRRNEFMQKVNYITLDPTWREIDKKVLFDYEDIPYSEYLIKKVLQVDMTMAIMQFAFTCHILGNSKKYKDSVRNEKTLTPGNNYSSSHSNSQSRNSKTTYTINVGQFEKKAKRERAIRARRESVYHKQEWDVRGHQRTYKNGTTIWIKPVTKKRNEKLIVESEQKLGKKYKINL